MEALKTQTAEAALKEEQRKHQKESKEIAQRKKEHNLLKDSKILDDPDLDIKVAKPHNFDGNPKNVDKFLLECDIMIISHPKKYETLKAKFVSGLLSLILTVGILEE